MTNNGKIANALLLIALSITGGCAYKINLSQGDERILNRYQEVEEGVSGEKVRNLLGEPQVLPLFGGEKWIYVLPRAEARLPVRNQNILPGNLIWRKPKSERIKVLENDFDEQSDDG